MHSSQLRFDYNSQYRSALAIILAGGRGTRLSELTRWRVKPAVPFGGKYRIIDFTLSNCINSGIRKMAVLTQYKSQSLIRHISRGWSFLNPEFGEFIETIPAQKRNRDEWYQGTADAVYQNMDFILKHAPEHTIILGGDHIYKMDYNRLLSFHIKNRAEITVASIEAPIAEGASFGVIGVDENYQVTRFEEKPLQPTPLPDNKNACLASMGIYVFNTDLLLELLMQDSLNPASTHDFGHDILPCAMNSNRVFAWSFRDTATEEPGYWRDVGTVDAYYQANMDLISVTPELNLYEREWPIRSTLLQHPPAKFVFNDDGRRGMAVDSMVSEGSIVSGAYVKNSLISTNVYIKDSVVEDSVVLPDVAIHSGCRVQNAIIDKYCVLPEGLIVGEDPEKDSRRFHVTSDGKVLVTPEMLKSLRDPQKLPVKQYLPNRVKLDMQFPVSNEVGERVN